MQNFYIIIYLIIQYNKEECFLKTKFRRIISLILVTVLVFSFGTVAFAASPVVTKKPNKTSFYQGFDWQYVKDTERITLTGSDIDLTGTVITCNGKTYSYGASSFIPGAPNMFSRPETGSWSGQNNVKPGTNTIKIGCDDFSGYATLTVNFVAVKKITVITPPTKTYLIKGVDWKLGVLKDVEYTNYRPEGLSIKAEYTDGTVKTVSYPENKTLSLAPPDGVETIYPGDATYCAIFCDKKAEFDVTFASSAPGNLGDVSKDGAVNSYDALLTLQHSTGIIQLDSLGKYLADVNEDYKINSSDALAILKYSVGLINKF